MTTKVKKVKGIIMVDYTKEEEQELILELYKKYGRMFYYISLKILQDEFLAEDAVQNSFLCMIRAHIIEHLKDIDSDNVKSYLSKIIVNESLKLRNKRKKEYTYETSETGMVHEEPAKYTVEMSVEDAINCREIMKKIEELPVIYSDILIEHGIRGRSYEEISYQTGIPLNTLKKRLWRARKLLRHNLEKSNKC